MPIFEHSQTKIIEVTFSFPEVVTACKKYSINYFSGYSQFQSPMNSMIMPIFDYTHPKSFESTLHSIKFYQHAKNHAITLFHSRNIVALKILQSDWATAFRPISQKPDLSQIWDLYRNVAKNIDFHYRPNLAKLIAKFFNNFKIPFFGPFWDILGKSFIQNIQPCHMQLHMGF